MIVVVGEKDTRSRFDRGATRARTAELFGVDEATMMSTVVWLNLWEYEWADPANLVRLVRHCRDVNRDAIVMLGRRVQRQFGFDGTPPLDGHRTDGGPMHFAIPHPSGLNRWYNDPDNAEDARVVMRMVWRRYRR